MRAASKGVTLTEMTVVVAVVALLTAFSMPAVRAFFNSLATQGNAKAMISAALSSARAIAAKEQRYAGIRFQIAYNPQGLLRANQYMIFIVNDYDGTGLVNGFRAVEGIEPIKLPDNVGVMDSRLIEEKISSNPSWEPSGDPELRDLTTFSIVFSPSGKMVIHDVRVRNRNGQTNDSSNDDIFNTANNVTNPANPVGMFVQDDYLLPWGLGEEPSRNSFVIYEREKFRQAYERGQAYMGYLVRLGPETIYINPYTGTIISTD